MPRRNKRNKRPSEWDLSARQNAGKGARWATNTTLIIGLVVAALALLLFIFGLGRDTPEPGDDLPEGHIRVPLELPAQSHQSLRPSLPGDRESA